LNILFAFLPVPLVPQTIWRAVAEDFAPFDVDVTTEHLGDEERLGNDFGTGSGLRVAVGGSSRDWYGAAAGGVAYVVS
jgi:hypothetical protein